MKLSITYKLLASFFIATVVVVASMLFLMQWSFERGFLEYVNTMEVEAHENLMDALGDYYEEYGTWDGMYDNWRGWLELQIASFMKTEVAREQFANFWKTYSDDQLLTNKLAEKPLDPRGLDPRGMMGGGGDRDDRRRSSARNSGFDPALLGPTGIFGNEARMRFDPRIALLDQDKELIVGNMRNASERQLKEITYNNNVIGYLAHVPRNEIFDNTEIRFTEEQGRTFTLIALVTAIISTIIALPLSRSLVKPIQFVAEGSRKLASGDYSVRIPEGSNDEIGRLAHDFNSLANTLEKNEDARKQWIADISHELRTPLAILRGEIESLQDGVRKATPERLKAIHNEILNLTYLVGDLYELSLSDIGALNYQKESINLIDALTQSINNVLNDFEDKSIKLHKHFTGLKTVKVFADKTRLNQLFTNLLVNSLRYTDPEGHLKINLGLEGSHVLIEFIDSEPGVPDSEIEKLFDRLYRLDSSRNRETGGAGLGLSICSNIVEAHEGEISAKPSPDGGLWVSVRLPLEH